MGSTFHIWHPREDENKAATPFAHFREFLSLDDRLRSDSICWKWYGFGWGKQFLPWTSLWRAQIQMIAMCKEPQFVHLRSRYERSWSIQELKIPNIEETSRTFLAFLILIWDNQSKLNLVTPDKAWHSFLSSLEFFLARTHWISILP